ncbi:hypothetical protein DNK34_23635 [Pseudomonas dryadis]|uniref:Uncharacterized protein n=1 Tax=Phytopseudomonas dryadis TaxID=2487520 RepID=A0ABY1YZX2_9GAMM|nr:hypothetical protein DNK34_23635 [Pseudomonas dryadis]TBV12977.1 hypothetical protein DNK41_23670 [Pseudomonas sp. FRB 230]
MGVRSVHSHDATRFRRLKTAANIILLIVQLITVAAYWGMVNARPEYQAISQHLYPNSEWLMNSRLADWLVSMPALLLVLLIFASSAAKEFAGFGKGRRILLNLLAVGALALLYGAAASPLYPSAAL